MGTCQLGELKPAQDGFIFRGEQPIDERNELLEKLRPALRNIGLPVGTGWHCFRRLHASLLQQAGASSIEASKLVGHVAIATTADHTVVGHAREAELVGGVCARLLLRPRGCERLPISPSRKQSSLERFSILTSREAKRIDEHDRGTKRRCAKN